MNNKGQIVRIISNLYTVKIDNKLYNCMARGKFKNIGLTPAVGDIAIIDINNNYILDIEKRKNLITRPFIANVDNALVVTSLITPDLSLNLLDKQLCYLEYHNIKPIIIITKKDLVKDITTYDNIFNYYKSIGYEVYYNDEIESIKKALYNKLVVLTGQTGAGKSTLINKLGNFNINTQEISKSLGRGKHTTRHVEIYEVDNIKLADTPGFSALDLYEISILELKNTFIEFNKNNCKFKDCLHDKEIGCLINTNDKILKSRYDNYIKFLYEIKNNKKHSI